MPGPLPRLSEISEIHILGTPQYLYVDFSVDTHYHSYYSFFDVHHVIFRDRFIRESKSLVNYPILFILKKDRKLRLYIGY